MLLSCVRDKCAVRLQTYCVPQFSRRRDTVEFVFSDGKLSNGEHVSNGSLPYQARNGSDSDVVHVVQPQLPPPVVVGANGVVKDTNDSGYPDSGKILILYSPLHCGVT